MRSASFVRIDLVGSAEPDGEGKCAFGKLNEERGTCIEKVRLTPEAGAPNIGSFTFDFSLNVDGFGNPLYFGESWDTTRYTNGVRISISAREHTYTESLSRGLFFLGGAAEDTRSPRCPEALEVATLSTAVPLVSVNTGSSENRRRLSTGMLSSDYNMDVENDFGAVTLNTGGWTTEIFSDSSAADMSVSVLDSTAIVDDVVVYGPTAFPTATKAAPNLPTIMPSKSPSIGSNSDGNDDTSIGSNSDGNDDRHDANASVLGGSIGASVFFLLVVCAVFVSRRKLIHKYLNSNSDSVSLTRNDSERKNERQVQKRFSFVGNDFGHLQRSRRGSNTTDSTYVINSLRSPSGLLINKLNSKMTWDARRLYLSRDSSILSM